jgi:hypothetical protein
VEFIVNRAYSSRTSLSARGIVAGLLTVWGAYALPVAAAVTATNLSGIQAAVRRDTERLAAPESRVVGSEGHAQALRMILEQARQVPGARVWTHEFPVVVPKVDRAVLTVDGDVLPGEHQVYPIWPDLARLKTTPAEGIAGQLFYIGEGALTNLPIRSLHGNIAVMEMSAYGRWMTPFDFGATAVLLLGSADDSCSLPQQQPINLPRYYVAEGPLADALRAGRIERGTLFGRASWTSAKATNVYALVQPATRTPGARALALAAAYDSMSIVMDKAPGADAALDTAFLLQVLRELGTAPPARPVLVCFTDAFGIDQLGMRQLMGVLTCTSGQQMLGQYQEKHTDTLEDYEKALTLGKELGTGEAALNGLNDPKHKVLHGYVKDELSPRILEVEDVLPELRLERAELLAAGQDVAEIGARIDALALRRADLNALQFQMLSREPISDRLRAEALDIWGRVENRIERQMVNIQERLGVFSGWNSMRAEMLAELGIDDAEAQPAFFLLGVDLSDGGLTVGPALYCEYLQVSEHLSADSFLRWLAVLERDRVADFWDARTKPFVNMTAALDRSENVLSFNVGRVATLTSPASSFGLPAVTWATLAGRRPRVDTPQDRYDRLDWGRIDPQVMATWQLVAHMARAPEFSLADATGQRADWRQVYGRIVDISIGTPIPRVPMEGYLVTLAGASGVPGVRRNQYAFTGSDGSFHFEPLASRRGGALARFRVEAYHFDEDGQIVRAVSRSLSTLDTVGDSSAVNLASRAVSPVRAVVFTCRELTVPQFFDSRFLEPLGGDGNFTFYDSLRGGPPKNSNINILNGRMSALVEPDMRWQIILRAGAAGTRMALVNFDATLGQGSLSPREAMQGFDLDEPLPESTEYLAARDFYLLDRWRMERFKRAGITCALAEKAHKRTAVLIEEADKARQADDATEYVRATVQALAGELRAYQSVRSTGEDVARGAIFLLLLLLPFSVAAERLLFASVSIARRITAVLSIFVGMTALLWSFHPAFQVSNQPIVIILAFAVLALSCVVISVVMQRFEKDLEELRRGRAEASGAKTTRGGVVGSAVWLGIANMRKRKVRTALTSITIMLVTFALLCFSSTSSYSMRREFRINDQSDVQPEVMIRQPSMSRLPVQALEIFGAILGQGTRVVSRWWWSAPPVDVGWGSPWRIHLFHPGTKEQTPVKAALGLDADEDVGGGADALFPDWERFQSGDGVYLSRKTADDMGLAPGDELVIGGQSMKLIGAFDAGRVEQQLQMLDGFSMLPLDFSALEEGHEAGSRQSALARTTADSQEATENIEPDLSLPHVTGDEVIILPSRLCRQLGGDLRSTAIRTESYAAARKAALALSDTLAFPVYYGAKDGVRVVVSTPILPRAARNLLIPLIIASLIIFTTMLNSVAERKGEIHIYTSLGLAPAHVAALFIAEAVTYGLLGSIFGYVVGQGTATLFTSLGWMTHLTLNYSGTQVIMTMLLVLAVVVLSAIVPSIMAARLAVPSKDMRWRLPAPQDGVITDMLPFTTTIRAANGLMLYIKEYIEAHADGAIGHFTADRVRLAGGTDASGGFFGVEATVWLTPYDLGVRQSITIWPRPVDEGDICEVGITLTMESGQEKDWKKLNLVFVGDLRRQLLGWRNLSQDRILAYISEVGQLAPGHNSDGDGERV